MTTLLRKFDERKSLTFTEYRELFVSGLIERDTTFGGLRITELGHSRLCPNTVDNTLDYTLYL